MMYMRRQPTVGRRGFNCEQYCTAGIFCGRLVHTLCTHDGKLSALAIANDFETTFVRVHNMLLHFNRAVLSGFLSRRSLAACVDFLEDFARGAAAARVILAAPYVISTFQGEYMCFAGAGRIVERFPPQARA